jgi:hypothetical protein
MRICLVMGAGASLANALYFRQRNKPELRPPLDTTFFETVDRNPNTSIGPSLGKYFQQVLGREPTNLNLREYRMEQVFGDVYYDFLENQTGEIALKAYTELVRLYLQVLRETTNWLADRGRTSAPVGRLIAAAAEVADEVSIITFNHDLVIENEIDKRAKLRHFWCVDQGYGSVSADINVLAASPGVACFGHHGDDCVHKIQIIKPHGSLNWAHRLNGANPTAKFLEGNVQTDLLLLPAKKLRGLEYFARSGRGRSHWNLWPLVVPPIYSKSSISSDFLQKARDDARAAVLSADRLVFFGYSLPLLDVEAEKLFERGIQGNPRLTDIDVINPRPDSASRFAGIAPERRLHWHPDLEQFMESTPPRV